MNKRASLPTEAVTITPGYSWRVDLDVLFNGKRPDDWDGWKVRMHIWGDGVAIKLVNGDGVRFGLVDDLSGGGMVVVPIIEMTPTKTELLRGKDALQYLIDFAAPDGEAEDYFSGYLQILYSPPAELLR